MPSAFRVLRDASISDETTQDTFLLLAKKSKRLSRRTQIAGWIHQSAVNIARTKARSMARRRKREAVVAEQGWEREPSDLVWERLEPFIDDALARLPVSLREPLILRYFEGRTQREAAAMIGCSESSVSKRLAKAIAVLREKLVAQGVTVSLLALTGGLAQVESKASSLNDMDTLIGSVLDRQIEASAASTSVIATVSNIMALKNKIGIAGAIVALVALVVGGLS